MSQIRQVSEWHYTVHAQGGPFDVFADAPGEWFTSPAIGSELSRSANLRSREEAEEWSQQTTWGPFGSAGLAAQWVIDGGWREVLS